MVNPFHRALAFPSGSYRFHAIEEVRKLVKSYNLVYKLQLEDSLMEEIILQCSNGVQVDIESLLRMLALEAP